MRGDFAQEFDAAIKKEYRLVKADNVFSAPNGLAEMKTCIRDRACA
jgi:hypothetical protein